MKSSIYNKLIYLSFIFLSIYILSAFIFSLKVNTEEEYRKVYVFFSCDVEAGRTGDPKIDIWGITKNEYHGINKMMDILEKRGVKGTFFVDVYEIGKYNEDVFKDICLQIHKRGHDLELHTHPRPMFPKVSELQNANFLEQTEIIKIGKELIYKWTNKDVIAHRAGGYYANYDSLAACYENGILMDSSMNYAYAYYQGLMHPVFTINQTKIFYPKNSDNLIKPHYLRGVLEIPVTAFDQFHFDILVSRTFLDIEVTSLEEFKKVFDSAIRNRIRTLVIMSHSFSFSRYDTATNIKLENKLDNLLNYINSRKELELTTFQDFFDIYKKDHTVIEGNSFIPTTGIWLTYLRSWERLRQGYKNIIVAFSPIILLFVIYVLMKSILAKLS